MGGDLRLAIHLAAARLADIGRNAPQPVTVLTGSFRMHQREGNGEGGFRQNAVGLENAPHERFGVCDGHVHGNIRVGSENAAPHIIGILATCQRKNVRCDNVIRYDKAIVQLDLFLKGVTCLSGTSMLGPDGWRRPLAGRGLARPDEPRRRYSRRSSNRRRSATARRWSHCRCRRS